MSEDDLNISLKVGQLKKSIENNFQLFLGIE
jgi:hypothetical protein